MKNFDQFHDGWLNGILLEEHNAKLFISTAEKQPFVLEIEGITSLKLDGFRQGNIIFDVLVRETNEITSGDIEELFGYTDKQQTWKRPEQVRNDRSVVIEIGTSYGASLLALARSAELIPQAARIQ